MLRRELSGILSEKLGTFPYKGGSTPDSMKRRCEWGLPILPILSIVNLSWDTPEAGRRSARGEVWREVGRRGRDWPAEPDGWAENGRTNEVREAGLYTRVILLGQYYTTTPVIRPVQWCRMKTTGNPLPQTRLHDGRAA
jgi:hypothetical protein